VEPGFGRAQPQPVSGEASTANITKGAARVAALIALPVAVVAGLAAYAVLGGFGSAAPRPSASGPVPMAAPALPEQTATVCRALVAALPGALRDRTRRPVTAGSEQNAAYGDPAITLACGAGALPSVDPTADVYALSGVCWYAVPGPGSTVWTAIDRTVPVVVTVPSGYDQPGQWVIGFSGPVRSSVPPASTVPLGCKGQS
jgi:hypothetical protein